MSVSRKKVYKTFSLVHLVHNVVEVMICLGFLESFAVLEISGDLVVDQAIQQKDKSPGLNIPVQAATGD